MKKVTLIRTVSDKDKCLGVLIVTDDKTGVEFVCRTLELPWKENAQSISCFAPGKYWCKHTMSPSFKIKTYEVTGVPNRAGIRIHSANYVSQLRGCIALGDSHKDINGDGITDVAASVNTVAKFEKTMNYEDFELHIIEI